MSKNIFKPLSLSVIIATVHGLYQAITRPPLQWFDSAVYDTSAWNFVQGLGFSLTPGIPDALREPGYGLFFLAPLYALFGHHYIVPQIVQILLVITVALLLYWFGRTYLSARVGYIGALLFGLYPGVIVSAGEIMTEIWFTTLLTVSLVVLFHGLQKQQRSWIIGAGALLGLATLTRFVTIFFPAIVLVIMWLVWQNWKKVIKNWLWFSIAFTVVVSPWLIRNYVVFDHFILGRTGGSEIYWTGSYIPWDGDWQGYQWPLTEYRAGLDSFEYDQKMLGLTVSNITADPLSVALLWFKKPLKIYFLPEGLLFLVHQGAFSPNHGLLTTFGVIAIAGHTLILLCAALFWFLRKRYHFFWLCILPTFTYFVVIYLPLNGVSRYAIPMYPWIFLLAVSGLIELINSARLKFQPLPKK